jgi:hypothetical protein
MSDSAAKPPDSRATGDSNRLPVPPAPHRPPPRPVPSSATGPITPSMIIAAVLVALAGVPF